LHKRFIFTFLIVLSIIVGISIYTTEYFKKSTTELQNSLINVQKNIETESWQKSYISLFELKNKWKDSRDNWSILIDHVEIDRIEESIIRLENNIKIQDKNLAIPEAAVLMENINHIYTKECFNIKNIL
jgi:hypothetical protein